MSDSDHRGRLPPPILRPPRAAKKCQTHTDQASNCSSLIINPQLETKAWHCMPTVFMHINRQKKQNNNYILHRITSNPLNHDFSLFQNQIRSWHTQLSHSFKSWISRGELTKGGLWYSEQGNTETCCVVCVQGEYKEGFWKMHCCVNFKKFLRCGCCSRLRLSSISLNWN